MASPIRRIPGSAMLKAVALLGILTFLGNRVEAQITNKHLPSEIKEIHVGNLILKESSKGNGGIAFQVETNGTISLRGNLGVALPDIIENKASGCLDAGDADECLEWGQYAKLSIYAASPENGNCARIEWVSTYARRLEDCFDLVDGQHWYGGIVVYNQRFPYNLQDKSEEPNLPSQGADENYWVTTNGASIHVNEDVPLFTSLNTVHKGQFCLVAKDEAPYVPRGEVRLNYEICSALPGEDILQLHRRTLWKYYEKPKATPDLNMLTKPFWSTWAQYHKDVDEKTVMEFTERIVSEGFNWNSHIQIDDDWETCYGDHEFNLKKFPDPAALVQKVKKLGFNATLWIHIWINYECPSFKTAFENSYFIRDRHDKPAITEWWDGSLAGIIDFSNSEAVEWWTGRVKKLSALYGFDSFKFDGGEYYRLPASIKLAGDGENLNLDNQTPQVYTTKFVETVSNFGGMVEVRVARGTQKEAMFTRMQDKNSWWGYDSGFRSLMPTILHYSMLGYSFSLPDYIGGNAYGGRPSKELYIRWMQANVLMPSFQISIVPWDYDVETVAITKKVLKIREESSELLISLAKETVANGLPINRPMWFVDPSDPDLFAIDDQYLVGFEKFVAPVVIEGAVTRDVQVPKGQWTLDNGETFMGPKLYKDVPAPLDTVLVFSLKD